MFDKIFNFFWKWLFFFLKKVLFGVLIKLKISFGYLILLDVFCSYLYPTLFFLKYHTVCLFNILVDIVAYDFPGFKNRFLVIYSLLSKKYNIRLAIRVKVKDIKPTLLSITSLYLNAGWLEREVHEFFGIYFYLNKDLRHLLLDYGFKGFPLLKDFPLSGFVDVVYSDTIKKISYRNLEQTQAYREVCLKRFLV